MVGFLLQMLLSPHAHVPPLFASLSWIPHVVNFISCLLSCHGCCCKCHRHTHPHDYKGYNNLRNKKLLCTTPTYKKKYIQHIFWCIYSEIKRVCQLLYRFCHHQLVLQPSWWHPVEDSVQALCRRHQFDEGLSFHLLSYRTIGKCPWPLGGEINKPI